MTNLETRLRETLDSHAGPIRTRVAPAGTVRAAHRRQIRFGVTVTAVAATFAALSIVLVSVGIGRSPVQRTTASNGQAGAQTDPPAGWPDITQGADPAYIQRAMKLYDQNSAGILTPPAVLASGRVDGRNWVVTGFETDGGGDWGGASGTCGNLFVETGGNDQQPQFGICLAPQHSGSGTPPAPAVARLEGGVSVPNDLTMYVGIVSSSVDRIEVTLADGSSWDPTLIPAPTGSGERFFVLFPPPRTDGKVVFLDANGSTLAQVSLCAATSQVCQEPSPS
jgi:hypothetical protein